MADSGLVNVRTRILRAPLRLSSTAEALQMIEQAFGAYRAVVADLTKESKAEAWAEVADCLKEFETSSGFATELEFAICAGAKTGWVLDVDRAARLVLSDLGAARLLWVICADTVARSLRQYSQLQTPPLRSPNDRDRDRLALSIRCGVKKIA